MDLFQSAKGSSENHGQTGIKAYQHYNKNKCGNITKPMILIDILYKSKIVEVSKDTLLPKLRKELVKS